MTHTDQQLKLYEVLASYTDKDLGPSEAVITLTAHSEDEARDTILEDLQEASDFTIISITQITELPLEADDLSHNRTLN